MCPWLCWSCISLTASWTNVHFNQLLSSILPCEEARCAVSKHAVAQTVALLGEAGAAAVTVHGRTAEQR